MEKSICSPAEPLASLSVLPALEKVLTIRAEISASNSQNSPTIVVSGGSSGKTSPVSYQVTAEPILPASFHCSVDGRLTSRQTGKASANGKTPGSSIPAPAVSALLGVCLTLNIPEYPDSPELSLNDGGVSSLSDIVVTDTPKE